ncbi:MAG: response regulator transcription factor [Bacteroidetes bacterium]|nr:response regulator transcription factor [Bacteroidota bacterium]
MSKIRILIADDHGVLRAGLRVLFNSQPDMEVCGEAASGREAIARTAETLPDLVLLDLKMPELGGSEAMGRIRAAHPAARVLVLTMYDDESYLRMALDAGASGYVLKAAADIQLLSAIRAVHGGGVYLDPALGRAVVEGYLSAKADPEMQAAGKRSAATLSEREREVIRLLAHGYTNQQIAEKLFLSVKTVEGYKARVCEKLGLRGRAALTRYALEKGLVSDPP